jgi:hypothetical protein
MVKFTTVPFNCPNCYTSYRLAYAKAESEPDEPEVKCKCVACDYPFPRRQGSSALRYFVIDESGKRGRESL